MKNFLFGLLSLFRLPSTKRDGYAPYADPKSNRAYNQLFCDKLAPFRKDARTPAAEPWSTLLMEEPYAAGLQAITEDASVDSKAKLLACFRLRQNLKPASTKELLGVVVEVRLPDGLDVLAAYRDGNVRYIHHREAVFDFEPAPLEWRPTMLKLFNAAQTAVDSIGPWEQPRAAPPTEGMIRMSFLATDGLYFGQGLLTVMAKDDLAGPIIAAGTELLKAVTSRTESQ